ncbi:CBS domain-containing protein [Sorangium sp. So ce1078]|uniref:CBS domain-containing protein n=1 Tax=Sorangium sp. So ce1078 TaxID=3133329 RepID=UPI003F5DDA5F
MSAELTETAIDVARRMRDFRVGCVVVTQGARAIGIITDRDLVMRVMADAREPEKTLVSEIVTYDPTTLQQSDSIETALRLMRDRGVRRLPIVRHDGKVTGIVTADDLTMMLAAELADLGAGIRENVEASETR